MNTFRNVMEILVVAKLDEVWNTIQGCKCEKCRTDIIAYTLNQLPPKYVVSTEGEIYSRLSESSTEQEFEILLALAKAIKVVAGNPKHTEMLLK